MHACTHKYACMHTHIHTHKEHVYTPSTHTHTHTHTHTDTHTHTHTQIHTHTHTTSHFELKKITTHCSPNLERLCSVKSGDVDCGVSPLITAATSQLPQDGL